MVKFPVYLNRFVFVMNYNTLQYEARKDKLYDKRKLICVFVVRTSESIFSEVATYNLMSFAKQRLSKQTVFSLLSTGGDMPAQRV